jgi:hypothetical protein
MLQRRGMPDKEEPEAADKITGSRARRRRGVVHDPRQQRFKF